MKYVKKIHTILINTSKGKFLVLAIIIGLLVSIITSIFLYLFFEPLPKPFIEDTSIVLFFKVVVFAPIFETFIHQWILLILPLKYMFKPTKRNLLIMVIVAAFIFGTMHYYSINYVFYAFIMGLYLNYIAVVSVFLRKQKINIFVSVFLVHLFINSFVFSIDLLSR